MEIGYPISPFSSWYCFWMELCVDNICMYVTKLCWGYVDVGWVELLFCPSYIKWSWILCQTDLDAFMCRKWFDMKWLILNLYSNITFEVKKVHTIETYPEKWINCVGKKLQMVICRHQVHPTLGVKQSACWYQRTGEKFFMFWVVKHQTSSDIIVSEELAVKVMRWKQDMLSETVQIA